MRITRRLLDRIIQDTVRERTGRDRFIVAVYLCGSLLESEFMLGGATDIDLVFIHAERVAPDREIVRLTDEVHQDISHHYERDYRQTRQLRVHPWLGPTIFHCKIIYDPQHFMDFTQASVRGQFYEPENVLRRARSQAEHARQIWFGYETDRPASIGPDEIAHYLKALDHAANSIALLNGRPLTTRRFLPAFRARAAAAGRSGLYPGLIGLLGGPNIEANEDLQAWVEAWRDGYLALPADSTPPNLHPDRLAYYRLGFESLLNGSEPLDVLWPLLRTWTQAAGLLPEDAPQRQAWESATGYLGLLGEGFDERLEAFDAYLDQVEETLDAYARANGVLI